MHHMLLMYLQVQSAILNEGKPQVQMNVIM